MTMITINIADDDLQRRLAARATRHGRTPEAEARSILHDALAYTGNMPVADNFYDEIRAVLRPVEGPDLELPHDQPPRDPPDFR